MDAYRIMVDMFSFFFGTLIEATSCIIVPLTLLKYNIQKNKKKIVLFVVLYAITMTLTFHMYPAFRAFLNVLIGFLLVKLCFGFNMARSFFAFLVYVTMAVFCGGILSYLIFFIFKMKVEEYVNSPVLHFVIPWDHAIFGAILVYIIGKLNLRMPDMYNFKLKAILFAMPVLQLTLLIFIVNDNYFSLHEVRFSNISFIHILVISSIFLSIYFLWKIFKIAERDMKLEAQDQMVQEINNRVGIMRTHRHDFTNHIQILSALLQENKVVEMKKYIMIIKEEIGIY